MCRRKFVTGVAGTGKTYTLLKKIAEDEKWGIVSSTTGISAVNLGTITINSLLGYFDTASLADLFISGRLTAKLARLSREYEWLWIDEISMMDGEQLDILHQAISQLDGYKTVERPIKLGITGDACQLPPVKAKWFFETQCWPLFEQNTERLSKVYRQTNSEFLKAINLIRCGKGPEGAEVLASIESVTWVNSLDTNFQGTTILGKNREVDNFNFIAHARLSGPMHSAKSLRWGQQRSEWKNIPEQLDLKIGAYVVILTNSNSAGVLEYANGDCGYVTDFDVVEGLGAEQVPVFRVKLVRNGAEVDICPIERQYATKSLDDNSSENDFPWISPSSIEVPIRRKHFDKDRRLYVHGAVEFIPLRLAYGATVHRTQGLSLDCVQMDIRGGFYSAPAMVYVALSRARTPEGLRIVGSRELMGLRCNVDPAVVPWL